MRTCEPEDLTDFGSTHPSVIESAQRRDPAAWRQLVEVYGPLVFYWCRRSALSPDDAADVVQEVFRSVAGALDQFDSSRGSGSFRGWLVTITTNKIRDHARRKARQPVAAGGAAAQSLLAQVPEQLDSDDERPAADSFLLRRALDVVAPAFAPRTWQAFWQTAVEGRSADDVGQQLRMSAVAVRKAKSRVLKCLREALVDDLDPPK
ncbi:MAG: RNA polymerase sigma factor [Candidatus Saccharimonadales bacterium]